MLSVSGLLAHYMAELHVHTLGLSTQQQLYHSSPQLCQEACRADVSSLPSLPFLHALFRTGLLLPPAKQPFSAPKGSKQEPCCLFSAQQPTLLLQHEKLQLVYGINCYYRSLPLIKQALPIPDCCASCIIHQVP